MTLTFVSSIQATPFASRRICADTALVITTSGFGLCDSERPQAGGAAVPKSRIPQRPLQRNRQVDHAVDKPTVQADRQRHLAVDALGPACRAQDRKVQGFPDELGRRPGL